MSFNKLTRAYNGPNPPLFVMDEGRVLKRNAVWHLNRLVRWTYEPVNDCVPGVAEFKQSFLMEQECSNG